MICNKDQNDKKNILTKKSFQKKSSYFRKDRGKVADTDIETRNDEDVSKLPKKWIWHLITKLIELITSSKFVRIVFFFVLVSVKMIMPNNLLNAIFAVYIITWIALC